MAQRQTRTVRQPATKFAHLRKKMDQRKLRGTGQEEVIASESPAPARRSIRHDRQGFTIQSNRPNCAKLALWFPINSRKC